MGRKTPTLTFNNIILVLCTLYNSVIFIRDLLFSVYVIQKIFLLFASTKTMESQNGFHLLYSSFIRFTLHSVILYYTSGLNMSFDWLNLLNITIDIAGL